MEEKLNLNNKKTQNLRAAAVCALESTSSPVYPPAYYWTIMTLYCTTSYTVHAIHSTLLPFVLRGGGLLLFLV